MAKEKVEGISKAGQVNSFELVGKAKVTDYTFSMDVLSEKSGYTYSRLNLLMNCGEKSGDVSAQWMGGYNDNQIIYAFGKSAEEEGKTDYKNRMEIAWDDREDESILEEVGNGSFVRVGIEKDKNGKIFTKKFLSPYDAIAYLNEHLEDGMVLRVKGNINYSIYNGNVQVAKDIQSIYLADAEPEDFKAEFVQSIIIDKDSVGKIDKENGSVDVDAIVISYMRDVKANYPYNKTFEYHFDPENTELLAKQLKIMFGVKKGYNMLHMTGIFVESGATVKPTADDIPEEFKELVTLGIYKEEDLLKKLADNGNKVKKMVLVAPNIRKDNEGNVLPWKAENVYTEDELYPEYVVEAMNKANKTGEDEEDEEEEEVVETKKTTSKKKTKVEVEEDDEEEEEAGEMPDWLKELE